MSYDVKQNTITVINDGVATTYDVERTPDRGSPEETLTLRVYDMETDEFIDPFPGLSATLGKEEVIEEHDSPRQWSNVGTMAVSYRGYDLGDEDISQIDFEIECAKCGGTGELDGDWRVRIATETEIPIKSDAHFSTQDEAEDYAETLTAADDEHIVVDNGCEYCNTEGVITLNPVEYFKAQEGATVVLPLIVFEHSGITMKVGKVGDIMGDSAGWDTSFVGFIYDTPEGVKQCLGESVDVSDVDIELALRSEVEVYASYLEGDVTFYHVQDDETDYSDSCGGFVGSHKECEAQCFDSLETAIVHRLAEEAEREYWKARDVQTI